MGGVSFKLNDFQYTINNKLTLIQACLKNKVDVPRFCFHEKLSIAGNCRMCLVEDSKQVKPIAACAINVSGSMSIYTNTLKVKKARESVLEFLLANHPLDCPICDQGGECDLQDQSVVFGSDRGRFYEFKRSVEDKDCGPLIKTIMNRCIHRTRCVRFSNEVAGVNILGVTGRGSKMEIGFYIENLMNSELSGNVIDLCPVGALTSKPFSFTSRPWELKSYNSIDILDGMHSNIRVDVRGTKIMRILPRVNENINEDWITDKIRFSYDAFRRQRLYDPMILSNSLFIKVSWRRVFFVLKNIFIRRSGMSGFLPLQAFVGNYMDLESLSILKKFLALNGSNYFFTKQESSIDNQSFYSFNTSMLDLAKSDICLLFDVNLRIQLPVLNSKIRQVSLKNNFVVYLIGYYSNFNYYVKHVSTSSLALLNILEGSHWLSSKFSKKFSKNPLFILSDNTSIYKGVFASLFSYTNIANNNWMGLNVISTNFSVEELGFLSLRSQNCKLLSFPVNWLYNYDSVVVGLSNDSLTIYQGHHGDINASQSSIILPSTAFIEKNSLYSNIFGMVQKTKKILFNAGNSRDDWKISNAFIEVLGFSNFRVNGSFDVVSLISRVTPFVLYRRNNKQSFLLTTTLQEFFHFIGLFSFFNNFYISDSITRNSKIMSLCSTKFKLKSYNFFR